MPRKENDKNVDYKARLEKKLYLARENPEPVFDLSECNLKAVPNNIFSLCRVFRKNALYLQRNKLSSLSSGGSLEELVLLTLLDISSNNFKKLPNDINVLKNLKILNVSLNQIKELPDTIGELRNLIHLDASSNQLRKLPDTIGGCQRLEYLNVEGNKLLDFLPRSLAKLHCLTELKIGSEIVYPNPDVCKGGVKAILKYLAEELGEDFKSPLDVGTTSVPDTVLPLIDNYNALQNTLKQLEKMKNEKQKEMLALERRMMMESKKEYELHKSARDKSEELMSILKTQQESLDEEISKFQENKESQRALLIKECNNDEKNANIKIKQIIAYNNALREKLAQVSERERREEEDLLLNLKETTVNAIKPAEKATLLASMNELLQEEVKRAENQSKDKRVKFVEALVAEDKKKFEGLRSIMKKYDRNQSELVEAISQDEELQKSAVSSLLERNDVQLWQIQSQVVAIESQLAVLTQVEMTRRKLEAETNLMELAESRLILTRLLMELFRRQSERREQLVDSIRRMENAKDGLSETFWLDQYERLLHSKSLKVVEKLKKIDPDLANEFFLVGMFHYLPILDDIASSSVIGLEKVTTQHLSAVGIASENEQRLILKAIRNYLKNVRISPSAPPEPVPSAPPPSTAPSSSAACRVTSIKRSEECVVCMDSKADVVFIPCGHVCCCVACSKSVSTCPLCRESIKHILEVAVSRSLNSTPK